MEVVEVLKHSGVIVQAKRNVLEGQKNEMIKKKKIKILSVMTNYIGKEWCYQALCTEQK